MTVAAVAREVGVNNATQSTGGCRPVAGKTQQHSARNSEEKTGCEAFKATASAPVDASGELDEMGELEGELVSSKSARQGGSGTVVGPALQAIFLDGQERLHWAILLPHGLCSSLIVVPSTSC